MTQPRALRADELDLLGALFDNAYRVGLDTGLAWARAVHGREFNPALPLKALTYYEDGDLPTLPREVKRDLIAAARSVKDIPVSPLATATLGAEAVV